MTSASLDAPKELLLDAINSGGNGASIAQDLFEAADLLDVTPALREALVDPAREGQSKLLLLKDVFGDKLSGVAIAAMGDLATQRWTSSQDFADEVGDLGLEACILEAMSGDEYATLCQQLIDAMSVVQDNRDLRIQLSDLGVGTAQQRSDLADTVFKGHLSPIALQLVRRAVFCSDYGQLMGKLRRYAERAAKATQKRLVIVYTAIALSADQMYRMAALASRQWDSAVELTTVVDPSVVGGFLLDAGEQSIDTTIRTDIAAARLALAG